jgi:hypothetical protein
MIDGTCVRHTGTRTGTESTAHARFDTALRPMHAHRHETNQAAPEQCMPTGMRCPDCGYEEEGAYGSSDARCLSEPRSDKRLSVAPAPASSNMPTELHWEKIVHQPVTYVQRA